MVDSKIYEQGYNNSFTDFQKLYNLRGRNVPIKSPLVKIVVEKHQIDAKKDMFKKIDDPQKGVLRKV